MWLEPEVLFDRSRAVATLIWSDTRLQEHSDPSAEGTQHISMKNLHTTVAAEGLVLEQFPVKKPFLLA